MRSSTRERSLDLAVAVVAAAAAPENERVAAFQSHDDFSGAGAGEHEFGELFLREAAVALVVAARDDFGGRRREPEQFGIHQHVADDDFGLTK